MSRKRRLSAEEEKLWQRITDTTTPIQKPKAVQQPGIPRKKPLQPAKPAYKPTAFKIGERATPVTPHYAPPAEPLRMDQKTFAKMRKGKTRPEARLDLHGMTVDAAHTALVSFLMRAKADGKRLVLVITGKGKPGPDNGPIPRRTGVLRQQLPHWLDVPPLRQIVLQSHTAHLKHGGSGAFYIYLRR